MRKFSVLLTALFLIGVSAVFGQGRSVSGKVLDSESGDPIIGASVEVVGAQTGTSTDENGDFTVTLPEGYNMLRFTQTSYKSQDLTARDGMVVRLVLASEVLATAEIEVAMGTKMGKGYVGSAQTVSNETIEKKSPSDVTKALSGEFAGVQIATATGQPGVSSSVRIRGISSLNAGGGALYVVDGIPYGSDISAIDPSDIVTTTVLKDATATALYGARGSNGVILITTKKGTAGSEGKIEVDLQAGVNLKLLPMHDVITSPEEYMEISWLGMVNFLTQSGVAPSLDVARNQANNFLWDDRVGGLNQYYNLWNTKEIIDPLTGKFNPSAQRRYNPESWKEHLFHTAKKYMAGVKISGGSDKTTYYTSINFLNDEGYSINSNYKRLSALSNIDYSPKKWLTANFKAQYSFSNMNNVGQEENSDNNAFIFVNAIPPIYPVFQHNADGSTVPDAFLGGNAYDYGAHQGFGRPFRAGLNPAGALQLDKSYTERHNVALSNYFKFEFVKDLIISITNGYNFNFLNESQMTNMYYGDGAGVGHLMKVHSGYSDFTTRQQISYRKTLADIHNLDAMLGHDFRFQESKTFWGQKSQILKPNDIEFGNAVRNVRISSYANDYIAESYMGELRYNYDEKYFAIVNGSMYGSSYFAPGYRYGAFWSVGASWNIHRETFMAETRKWLSSLKIRGSYGTSGNDQIGNYHYLDMYAINNAEGRPSVSWQSIATPNLTWEKVYKTNLGLDLELKKGRLYLEFDVYNNLVVNNLDTRRTAPSLGYISLPVNDGKFRSYGFELLLRSNVIKTRNFNLDLRATMASAKAILLENPRELVKGKWIEMAMNGGRARGHYLGDIYIRHFKGVDPNTGWGLWEQWYDIGPNGDGDPVRDTHFYEFENTVVDGVVKRRRENVQWDKTRTTSNPNEASTIFIGKNVYPDLYGGFGLDVSAYGFDLSASFDYIIGGYNIDGIYANLMSDRNIGAHNYHKDILKAWNPLIGAGQDTNVPGLLAGLFTKNGQYRAQFSGAGDRFLTPNTGLRLGSVRLAYNFPKKMIEKLQLNNLSLWVVADNLFVLSHRKGYNPFTGFTGGNALNQYSPLSTVMGGIKFSF